SFTLYNQTGTITSNYSYQHPESIRDLQFGAMAHIQKWLGVGVTRSKSRSTYTDVYQARIPPPTGSVARTATGQFSGLTRTQEVWHIEFAPIDVGRGHVNFAVFLGPSIMNVKQDVVTGVSVRETSPVAVVGPVTQTTTNKVIGFHGGCDLSVFALKWVGFGGGVRFVRGTVQPAGTGATTVLGGTQFSVGLRFRI